MAVPKKSTKRRSAKAEEPSPMPAPTPDSLDEEEDDEPAVRLKSAGEDLDNEKEEKEEVDDWEDDGVPEVNEAAAASAAERREVDQLTDRIFSAVLSRYGWEQHGNRIEHVGEDRRRR